MAHYLISTGTNVNVISDNDLAPLLLVIENSNPEICEILIGVWNGSNGCAEYVKIC